MTAITGSAAPIRTAGSASWSVAAVSLLAGTAAILAMFADAVLAAWRVWTSSATFNHCLLVVPIAAYLAHARRHVFAVATPAPMLALPATLALLGSAAWLIARTATIYEVQHFALVGILQCLLLAVLGWRIYAALLLPCLYLFFLVPTGEQLVPALQGLTTAFIVAGLDAIGIPNYADGVFISIPSGNFHVAEACAGLRFLIASLAYGVLFADLTYRSWRRRVVFLVLSIALPILANGVRALGIVLIAHYSNYRYAVGVDHIVYGWGFFLAVTMLLTWIGRLFADRPDIWRASDWMTASRQGPAWPRSAIAASMIVAMAAIGPAYAAYLETRGAVARPAEFGFDTPPGWTRVPASGAWHPVFRDPTAEWPLRFEDARGNAVDLHVVFYATQRKGAELVAFANDLQDERWRRVADGGAQVILDGGSVRMGSRRILSGPARRTVLVAYWVDGRFVSSRLEAKLAQVAGALVTGRRAAAAVLLSTDADDEATALRVLGEFARETRGLGAALAALAPPSR